MKTTTRTRTLTLTLTFLLVAGAGFAREARIAIQVDDGCPRRALSAEQIVDCLTERVSASHRWEESLEVKFELAVLHRGRVTQRVETSSEEFVTGIAILLAALPMDGRIEIPGGDTFIPGGDTFIPGGDMFIEGEEEYRRFLDGMARRYSRGESETVLTVVARPKAEELLSRVGIAPIALALNSAE